MSMLAENRALSAPRKRRNDDNDDDNNRSRNNRQDSSDRRGRDQSGRSRAHPYGNRDQKRGGRRGRSYLEQENQFLKQQLAFFRNAAGMPGGDFMNMPMKPYNGGGGGNGGGQRSRRSYAQGPVPKDAVKVSYTSVPKSVAGSIAHVIRSTKKAPPLLATGPSSLNQAIKAFCVARRYLIDDENEMTDIISDVNFESPDSGACTMNLKSVNIIEADPEITLTVKHTSEPGKVAGAIAHNVRAGKSVKIISVGSIGVFRTLKAIAAATAYLDPDDINLKFAPQFTEIDRGRHDGELSTAIEFILLTRRINR